jgi:hypothetical protein
MAHNQILAGQPKASQMTQPRRIRWRGPVFGSAVVLVGLVAGCATAAPTSVPPRVVKVAPGVHPGSVVQDQKVVNLSLRSVTPSLPAGYTIESLTGDPVSTGVFLVASNSTEITLFHWTKSAPKWKAVHLTDIASIGGVGAIVLSVTHTGSAAWIGLQTRLIHVDLATNAVVNRSAPLLDSSASAEAGVPKQYQKFHNVIGLAASSSGGVAVVESRASSVAMVSSTGAITQVIPLPANTAATASSFNRRGDLAVALVSYPGATASEVLLYSHAGRSSTIAADSVFLASEGDGFFSGGSLGSGVESLSTSTTQATPVPMSVPPSSGAYRAVVGSTPMVTPNGDLVYATVSGVAASTPSATEEFVLPGFACGNQSEMSQEGPSGGASSIPAQNCAAYPVALSSDGAGNIWYQSSAPDQSVGEIAATTYGS